MDRTASTQVTHGHHPHIFLSTLFGIGGILVISSFVYIFVHMIKEAPSDFPLETDIHIEEGLGLREIANVLEEKHVVRSSLYFYVLLNYKDQANALKAGTYRFSEKEDVYGVAQALIDGKYQLPLISVTLPEGFGANELFSYLPQSLGIEKTDLREYEGYLFPDTYFLSPEMSLSDIVTLLRQTHDHKLAPMRSRIAESGFTEREILTFASIIEREAGDTESKHIVAGILHNRLRIGMPLQVDAVFDYLLDKSSHELTEDDLDIDSPYNTYRYRGLPPGPIANPGLASIEAVLSPTKTSYLYYLTAPDGTFYYAEDFEQHKKNKERYLR